MKRHFRIRWESEIGPGVVLHEFDGEEPTRQVERYGDRWFSSRDEHHPELGPGLVDVPLSALDLGGEDEISAEEFEEAWRKSGRDKS
jgi:hypothetical protein